MKRCVLILALSTLAPLAHADQNQAATFIASTTAAITPAQPLIDSTTDNYDAAEQRWDDLNQTPDIPIECQDYLDSALAWLNGCMLNLGNAQTALNAMVSHRDNMIMFFKGEDYISVSAHYTLFLSDNETYESNIHDAGEAVDFANEDLDHFEDCLEEAGEEEE